ncbi:hypothetical protein [Hyphobacterium sp.]|uniref:hypothetical protein n=1 Tax=Hyphobacterium sp. TaxID=2004662 RepID=UPI003747C561
MHRTFGLCTLAVLTLSACDTAATEAQPAPGSMQTDISVDHEPPAVSGQSFTATQVVAGYYLPQDEVAIGSISLDHISVGLDWEFEEYQSGSPDAFTPLAVIFEDTSSPTGVGELGNTYYEVNHVLVPDEYAVSDDGLAFSGTHDVMGDFHFDGRWNMADVEQMQAGYPEQAQSALTGTLTLGDVVFEDIVFQGWLGD